MNTQQFELQYSSCSRWLYTYEIKTPRLHTSCEQHWEATHTYTGKSTEQVILYVLYLVCGKKQEKEMLHFL